MVFSFAAIGVVHSAFKEKFGIPRQPGLAPLAQARIEIYPPYNDPAAFSDLQGISHIWLQFVFHQNRRQDWKPRVKMPRLGGNKTLSVFASRSPVRPNPIGLSVVQLLAVNSGPQGLDLLIAGADLLDGTPVLDIKPYLPYADALAEATNPLAPQAPPTVPVVFAPGLEAVCAARRDYGVDLTALIRQLLQQDPKPQYQTPDAQRIYGMRLWDFDVQWRYLGPPTSSVIEVVALQWSAQTPEPRPSLKATP